MDPFILFSPFSHEVHPFCPYIVRVPPKPLRRLAERPVFSFFDGFSEVSRHLDGHGASGVFFVYKIHAGGTTDGSAEL